MKKLFITKGFRTLVTLVLLVGGLMVTGRAEAQSQLLDDQQLQQHQQYSWVTESEAVSILETALFNATTQLEQQVPGSPQYKNNLFHIHCYKSIMEGLDNNQTTENSVLTGMDMMIQEGYGTDINPSFSTTSLFNLYMEVVDMLTF